MVCEFQGALGDYDILRRLVVGSNRTRKLGPLTPSPREEETLLMLHCNYTEGTSEKCLGEIISLNRDYLVLATIFLLQARSKNPMAPNGRGNSRKKLLQSVEFS